MAKASELPLSRFTPLTESARGRAPRSQADGTGRRVYKGVTVIKAGLGNARDKNYYPVETLEAAVKSGLFNGLRAYADHQDAVSEEVQPERTIRDMVGVYENPRFLREGRTGGRVIADLHLFRSAKWLGDTVDDLIDLGQADKIGLSINGRGRTTERQLQLEEAADPINVNWVEDFMVLRSADVVTEAGAGGGFQQLLESARGSSKAKENAMKGLTDEQKKALKEAVDAGDLDKVAALMQECGVEAPAKPGVKPTKRAAVAEAEDAEVEESEESAEEADADDTEDQLDAVANEIVAEADGDEDGEDAEEADAEDAELDDDEDLEEADGRPAREARGSGLKGGAGKLISGRSGGKHGATIKGPKDTKGSMVKPARLNSAQKGRRYAESGDSALLQRKLDRALAENARLSAQLRVRTTTDRARNLLRESAIPGKMQPEVLRLLVGKSENEMRNIIRYHERMIETAIEESVGGVVEGAGSSFRESNYGAGGGDRDITALMGEVGVPLRGK